MKSAHNISQDSTNQCKIQKLLTPLLTSFKYDLPERRYECSVTVLIRFVLVPCLKVHFQEEYPAVNDEQFC